MELFSVLDETCIGYICDALGGPYCALALRATCRTLRQMIRAPAHKSAQRLVRDAICSRPRYDWNLYEFAFRAWTQPIIDKIQPEVDDDDREACAKAIIMKTSLRAIRWAACNGDLELCERIRIFAGIDKPWDFYPTVFRGAVRGGHVDIVRALSKSRNLGSGAMNLLTAAGKSGNSEIIEIVMEHFGIIVDKYNIALGAARVGDWDTFDRMETHHSGDHKKMIFAAYSGHFALFFEYFDLDSIEKGISGIYCFVTLLGDAIENGHIAICREALTRIKPRYLEHSAYESLLSAAARSGSMEMCTIVYDWVNACNNFGIDYSEMPALEPFTPNAQSMQDDTPPLEPIDSDPDGEISWPIQCVTYHAKLQDKLLEFAASNGHRKICEYAYFTLGATDIYHAMYAAFNNDHAEIFIMLRDWIVARDHCALAVEKISFTRSYTTVLCQMIAKHWHLMVERKWQRYSWF